LVEGQPLSGTIGYAFGEFIQIQERQVSLALVNQVREYVGLPLIGEPAQEQPEQPAETAPEEGEEIDLGLPTVTPTPEGGAPAVATEEATAGEAPSMTVTVNAVNGVNVRQEPN